MGMGMGMSEKLCTCGNPSADNDHLCAKCRYFNTVFKPPPREFESKRDVAIRAIENRKLMRDRVVVIE